MNAPPQGRTFKSGNSVALRIPAALGIAPGLQMAFTPHGDGFMVLPVRDPEATIDLTGIYGSVPGLAEVVREQRARDDAERDWGGFAGDD